MSEPKFTSGPWGLDEDDPCNVLKEDSFLVAVVSMPCDFPCFDPEEEGNPSEEEFQEECEANARLIACAPEMYEELQEVLEAWESGEPDIDRWWRQCGKIAALLVKARGEVQKVKRL